MWGQPFKGRDFLNSTTVIQPAQPARSNDSATHSVIPVLHLLNWVIRHRAGTRRSLGGYFWQKHLEPMESLIPIVVLVFAFSMVSERLANLFKLYLPAFTPNSWQELELITRRNRWRYVLAQLHIKHKQEELETIRQRAILLISLFCGWATSAIFHKEITGAFRSPDRLGAVAESNTLIIFGFGILFSFGSKFWHDLLDLLLFSKNIRRRIQDIDPEEMTTAGEVEKYLTSTDEELLRESLAAERSTLERMLGSTVRRVVPGYRRTDGRKELAVFIYIEGKVSPDVLPKYMPLKGSNRTVPVVVVSELGEIQAQARPGAKIRVFNSNSQGSFGAVVYRNGSPKPYILTCGHNVTKRRLNVDPESVKKTRLVTVDDDQIRCADFRLEDYVDFAFLEASRVDVHKNVFDNQTNFQGIRRLLKQDEINQLDVYFIVERAGRPTKIKGRIKWYSIPETQTVRYDDGSLRFRFLIGVENPNDPYSPPTEEGDSGTLCYDAQGRAIGLVTGADKCYTYLQSLYRLADNYHFDFSH